MFVVNQDSEKHRNIHIFKGFRGPYIKRNLTCLNFHANQIFNSLFFDWQLLKAVPEYLEFFYFKKYSQSASEKPVFGVKK